MLLIWLLACGQAAPEAPSAPQSAASVTAAGARAAAPADRADPVGEVLGAYPLCEPSAVLRLEDGALLVADNEGRPADPKDGEDARPSVWVVPTGAPPRPVLRAEAAQDVESLLRLGDELWVLGSLSRNKDCEVKGKRWELHVHPVDGWTADTLTRLGPARVLERKKKDIAQIEGSVSGCLSLLFRGVAEAEPVCQAIVRAAASPTGRQCDALNVEGAAVVDGRIWVGLRAPLVDGKAVLARLDDGHDALAFDAVRLVDLGGQGIRELVVDGDRLVGIAGNVLDGDAPSRLFSVPLSGLEAGELPVTVLDPALPPTAEGVALLDGSVRYVIDGSTGDGPACEEPARIATKPR